MHWLRLILFNIVPLLLALAAPVLLVWAWGNGLPLLPALLVGLLFLSAALVAFLLGVLSQPHAAEEQEALWLELETLRQQVRQLQARQTTAEQGAQAGQGTVAPLPADTPERDESRHVSPEPATLQGAAMQQHVASDASLQEKHVRQEHALAPRLAMQTKAPDPGATPDKRFLPAAISRQAETPEGFQLYMEPVVELNNRQTWMYRAVPALPAQGGQFFLGRHAQLRARALGRAGGMQVAMLRDCLRFAAALLAQGATLPVICPLDVAALAQTATHTHLLQLLGDAAGRQVRHGLLLSIQADELARASRQARQHLLDVAGYVDGFVLEHGSLPDADAPLPLPLTVRYLDAPATALGLAGQLSDVSRQLEQFKERGMTLIASGIDNEGLLAQARPLAALGRGRHLGEARRVLLPSAADSALAHEDADRNAVSQAAPSSPMAAAQ